MEKHLLGTGYIFAGNKKFLFKMIKNIENQPDIPLIFVRYGFIMKSICYEGEKAYGGTDGGSVRQGRHR